VSNANKKLREVALDTERECGALKLSPRMWVRDKLSADIDCRPNKKQNQRGRQHAPHHL